MLVIKVVWATTLAQRAQALVLLLKKKVAPAIQRVNPIKAVLEKEVA